MPVTSVYFPVESTEKAGRAAGRFSRELVVGVTVLVLPASATILQAN